MNKNVCSDNPDYLVKTGKLKAVAVIPQNFSDNIKNGRGDEILLYVDNSKSQISLLITDAFKAFVQDLNEDIGTKFIHEAWINLRNLNDNIKLIIYNLENAKVAAEKSQYELNMLNNNLSLINETLIDIELDKLNSTLNKNIIIGLNVSDKIKTEAETLRILFNECKKDLGEESLKCIYLKTGADNIDYLAEKIKISEIEFNNLSKNFMINSNISIDKIKKSKEEVKSKIIELNKSAYDYTSSIISLTDDLKETSRVLNDYTQRDPKNIVSAVSLNNNDVFGKKSYFEFLSPGLLLVILLFTLILISSSNIVLERNMGTMARTLLSPTSIISLIISKVIYFAILSIIEIIVMSGIILLFGISLNFNAEIILILLFAAVNFILLGLFVGSISGSENTALLTSLVLVLPMFFLSNLFFPFEVMPKFMQFLGKNLPLTLAINGLESVDIYLSGMNYVIYGKMAITSAALLVLVYFAIKRKPTPF